MSRYCIIPARGASKRIPRKNLRNFFGKPIIAHSIETAKASGLFTTVYVSTDDAETMEVAQKYGASILKRPAHLAEDHVGTPEVMQHHASEMVLARASFMCCVYPCAPLMTVEDLHTGLTELKNYGADFAFGFADDPLRDTGTFYWGKSSAFLSGASWFGPDTIMVPIPPERACDINDESDFLRAQLLYEAMRKRAA